MRRVNTSVLPPQATISRIRTRRATGTVGIAVGRKRCRSSESFREGSHGVFDLCLRHCGLSMSRIRELYSLQFSTTNVVVDLVDKCVGKQFYETPNFWQGGVDDAATIKSKPEDHFYQLAIYGGLFGPTLRAFLEGGTLVTGSNGVVVGDVATRLEFLKYCVPDPYCVHHSFQSRFRMEDGEVDPIRRCDRVGPYKGAYLEDLNQNQNALEHMLESTLFNNYWRAIRSVAGPEFYDGPGNGDPVDSWKQHLWQITVMSHGLDAMQMVGGNGRRAQEWKGQLVAWRDAIARMDASNKVSVGPCRTYEFPYLKGDIEILIGPW
ncbi:hypothetical protein EJ04DRAFT_597883 [Polyplosphaeria fusca]|uniref:Uncharacterized protein n=1 Tax=Polyplosphaeria fusca TaxID=682080 RepID=A0A9P4RCK4_9PLEO|nr:hypothetical protein EJ04DRAFT_597883 [Polyplosphaeria fusca]